MEASVVMTRAAQFGLKEWESVSPSYRAHEEEI